jgi:hypothetical protein
VIKQSCDNSKKQMSWEDEDFEVPAVIPVVSLKKNWDEEEDEALIQETVFKPVAQTPAMIEAAAKKAAEQDALLQLKIQQSLLEKETPEDRKAREKKLLEDENNELTKDLFSGLSLEKGSTSEQAVVSVSSTKVSVKGLGGISLKNKQDHANFGVSCAQKLSESSAFNLAAYFKSLSDVLIKETVTTEVLEEILATITKIKTEKLKAEKPATKKKEKKSKKDILNDNKYQADKFGDSIYHDKYDSYTNLEDDFF